MADDQQVILTPGDAAQRLGVSPSGLRRLAGVYGQMFGPLPKDSTGTSRLWPQEAVVRLHTARLMLAAGQARTIRDALQALERGAEPTADAVVALGQEGRVVEALGLVVSELRSVSETNSALRVELQELRGQVAQLRAAQSQPEALPWSEGPAEQQQAEQAPTGQPVDQTPQGEALGARPRLLVKAAEKLELLLNRLFRG